MIVKCTHVTMEEHVEISVMEGSATVADLVTELGTYCQTGKIYVSWLVTTSWSIVRYFDPKVALKLLG